MPAKLIQRFVAHTAPVNCISLGHKHGMVFATGGDDRNVNVWKVGKPVSLMSFVTAKKSVISVAFDGDERRLVTGSLAGTARVLDLQKAKQSHTLKGHRAGCACADFHPFSESFLVTGSMDNNLKLWDLRTRSVRSSYTSGHVCARLCA